MDLEAFRSSSSLEASRSSQQSCSSHFLDFVDQDLSYSRFFRKQLLPNRPCMFSSRFTRRWSCRRRWVTPEGRPHFHNLLQDFDETPVPVANCSVRENNANPKQLMPFKEFVHYWRDFIQNGHSSPRGCLYLKDWHMARDFPGHGLYSTPLFFSSDWLNEFWDSLDVDDFRFVYMGPKGSWTPFHADVLRSYSWSANICGRKKWLLFPPGQEGFLRDARGNLPYDVTSGALQDPGLFPRAQEAGQPLEVIQEAGEIIFVPSGWHHQVYNLEDTISINHNWLNGCSLDLLWSFLQSELLAVQQEVQQWRDSMEAWHQHCQVIMKACSGMDYAEFASFLKLIAENRMAFLGGRRGGAEPHGEAQAALAALGPFHAAFDLQRVAHVVEQLLCNDDFKRLDQAALDLQPEALLLQIRESLQSSRGQHLLYQD